MEPGPYRKWNATELMAEKLQRATQFKESYSLSKSVTYNYTRKPKLTLGCNARKKLMKLW